MKKLYVFLISVMVLNATGCARRSVGVIGGADGPTKIIVGEKNGKVYRSEKEPVKAVMIDGCIYYETGEDNDAEARCGVLDGSFEKAVDKWELPKNDNESNFEIKNNGYQVGVAEDTIEILIGDDWEIFRKIYDSEKDLTQYKYIIEVEGDTQYKFGEKEYIVLTNDLDITANDVAKSLFSSDSGDYLDVYIVEVD